MLTNEAITPSVTYPKVNVGKVVCRIWPISNDEMVSVLYVPGRDPMAMGTIPAHSSEDFCFAYYNFIREYVVRLYHGVGQSFDLDYLSIVVEARMDLDGSGVLV